MTEVGSIDALDPRMVSAMKISQYSEAPKRRLVDAELRRRAVRAADG